MSPLPFLTVVAAGARVQAPFTLSETWTWPARLYWANQPTSRSPAPTALVKLTVLDATRDEVVNAEPWMYEAPEAADAGTADRPTKAPRASNGTSHQAVPLRPSGPCRNVLLGPVPGTGPRCRVAGQPASASRMQPASRRRLRLSSAGCMRSVSVGTAWRWTGPVELSAPARHPPGPLRHWTYAVLVPALDPRAALRQ